MLALLGVVVVIAIPFALIVGLLLLAGHVQEARAACAARQVAVTDAIHRELGAVVAPWLTRRRGSYRLVIPAPLDRPGVVASALAIAYGVLRSWDAEMVERVQIVVVPQPVVRAVSAARLV
jgi:hypothetical protein